MERERKPMYEIREATIDDVEAIRTMHAQSWRDTYRNDELGVTEEWLVEETESWLTPERIEQAKEHLGKCFSDPSQLYRGVFQGGQAVGMVHVTTKRDGTKHLAALYLRQDTHGTGLAQRLMTIADTWIGDSKVDLEVASYNERAKAFYRKCGFIEAGEESELFKGKIPVIRMVRDGSVA